MSGNISDQFNYVGYQTLIEKYLSSDNASATLKISNSTTELNITGNNESSSVRFSLSPEAQQEIAKQQIALTLISTNHQNQEVSNSATSKNSENSNSSHNFDKSNSPNDISYLTNSVRNVIASGQQDLKNDPYGVFNSFVEQSGGAAQYIAGYGNASLQSSFIDAFNNGTLKVQNAAEVSALGFAETSTFTGSGGSSSGGWNSNVQAQLDTQNGTYSVGQILPGFGALYVTWANPSAST